MCWNTNTNNQKKKTLELTETVVGGEVVPAFPKLVEFLSAQHPTL